MAAPPAAGIDGSVPCRWHRSTPTACARTRTGPGWCRTHRRRAGAPRCFCEVAPTAEPGRTWSATTPPPPTSTSKNPSPSSRTPLVPAERLADRPSTDLGPACTPNPRPVLAPAPPCSPAPQPAVIGPFPPVDRGRAHRVTPHIDDAWDTLSLAGCDVRTTDRPRSRPRQTQSSPAGPSQARPHRVKDERSQVFVRNGATQEGHADRDGQRKEGRAIEEPTEGACQPTPPGPHQLHSFQRDAAIAHLRKPGPTPAPPLIDSFPRRAKLRSSLITHRVFRPRPEHPDDRTSRRPQA